MRKLTFQNKRFLIKKSRKRKRALKPAHGQKRNYFQSKVTKFQAPSKYINLDAPEIFNLQYENVNNVLSYIAKVKAVGKQGNNVFIGFQNITEIGEGALAMLLSVLEELTDLGVMIKGNNPQSSKANEVLEKSGFFSCVESRMPIKNRTTKNTITKKGVANTSQSFLSKQIRDAMDTVWGLKGRNPLVYSVVFEMMRNSCDHAFKKSNLIKWHLAITHIDEDNLVKFSFVDNGKGIVKTLNEGVLGKFISVFKDNSDVIHTAFLNGIESRTGLSWRGKGLPTIYENYSENYLRNLVVISNDVFIDFDREICEKLDNSFDGTYYFWVVNTECEKICFP